MLERGRFKDPFTLSKAIIVMSSVQSDQSLIVLLSSGCNGVSHDSHRVGECLFT